MGSFVLLEHFGRKTLMAINTFLMGVMLMIISISSMFHFIEGDKYSPAFIFIFVILFEYSIGPITWLYMSEVMVDKGVAIGATVNWISTIIITISTPYFIPNIKYWFMFFAGCNFMTTLFSIFLLKETKGLTE